MVAALHSYTHPTWLRIWGPGPGSLMLSRVIVCGISYNDVCGLVYALLPSLCGCCILCWHCCLAVLASLPSLCCVPTLVMLALLSSSLHSNRLRCWASASLVESKWCYYVMVEADSHLGLLPTSILHIYKVFEHIDMTSIGIHQQPLHSYTYPIRLRCGGSVSLVESKWCHCVMVDADTTLKLLHASILDIFYTVVEHIDMLSIGTW